MTNLLPTLKSPAVNRTLIATIIIAVILVAANFTVIDAQPSTSATTSTSGVTTTTIQQAPIQNEITTPPTAATAASPFFQSTNDSFSIQIPQGWQIQDLNNSGSRYSQEVVRGYGVLAQLCPVQEPQQQTSSLINSTNTNGCTGTQQEVIHIVRYPNLDTGINQTANNVSSATTGTSFSSNNNQTTTGGATFATTTIDNILAHHLQKLQEVGYNSIQIVNNVDTRVNLTMIQANQTVTTLPAKFGEIVYTTASAPGEIKRGYFVLTATNATLPNLGTTKGYSVFYEGNVLAPTATSSGLSSLPPAIGHAFDSFELIVAPEVERTLTRQPTTDGQAIAGGDNSCDPSYPNVCIPSPPPQLNCDSPSIPTNFRVAGSDPHRFDADNDGIGCETAGAPGGSGMSGNSGGSVGDGGDGGDESCHPSYPDTCISPPPPDLNCDDVGDTNFEVVGSDPHGFDRDNDGIGCESGGGVTPDDDGEDIDDCADDDDGDDGGGGLEDCEVMGGPIVDDCDLTPDDDGDDGGGDGGGDDGDDGGGDGGGDDGDDGGGDGGGDEAAA